MATYELNTTAYANTNGNFFARLLQRVATWNEMRQTRIALMSLSDHELADIGLTHADIDAIVSGKLAR
ncbi:DUF1127 domain-containing protein [Ketogulonicigenium vulgare]|uniref:YjiS-like domain-containing protein n=1 Tax=Ketogulonicigenium vulgare (strain WSH-001) TaxID=759362 RepID=F9YAL3_KETVW|nr:DUF1127 domain-containing protein [Ketogulonicigenium vulgare]AEM41544.1 hypothetical protein KVU_1705 [Ketogulonicigenium vulgare WSH-001]ANW35149.1 hypothetical protein KvSKV_11005 [Ketogulonicigenium vulgare]